MSENKPTLSKTTEIKIGRVTYIVNVYYKSEGRENAEQKYLKYVTNRVSEEMKKSGNTVI